MLKTKTFTRKTKKGAVIKVIKEHYLRDDIGCGIVSCSLCKQLGPVQLDPSINIPNPFHSVHKTPHYIIPDTNVLYHQIDLIENSAFKDIIILQTVLDELRHKSQLIYNRIRRLTADPDRRFYVFCNEHHRDTFIEKLKLETPNDRNDRAIRVATQWYTHHNETAVGHTIPLSFVLLTDDTANKTRALEMGISSYSVYTYVEGMKLHPEFIDMLALKEDSPVDDKKFTYPDHLTPLQINAGLKNGLFYQGTLNVSTHNYLQASIFANINGQEKTIVILGRLDLNRAIQGDTVAIELLPKEEWISSANQDFVLEEENEEDEQPNVDANTTKTTSTLLQDNTSTPMQGITFTKTDPSLIKPVGKVVGIIKRNTRPYCGTIESTHLSTTQTASTLQTVWFWALDKRIPKIRIRSRQSAHLIGKRIVVAIDTWPAHSKHPLGHFVKTLGAVGDKSTETEVLLLEYDIPFTPFTPDVLASLPEEGDKWIFKQELHSQGREDFRHLDVCSIDPPGCTDIDDALHARSLPNGNYEVGVHIADVSHFVKGNTAMDDEASKRGTTVYLVDKRIDMLPSLLGTNLCSLRCDVDRLAFSCIWEMTPSAEIVSVRYTKSVIRSRNSFTYDAAQARLVDAKMVDPVSMGIKTLDKLAKQLRAKRMEAGALVLASPEVRFRLENDSQDPVDIEMKELKDTNALVEEFMLLANIYVAKKIYTHFPDSSVLRRHPKPPVSNFETLKRSAASYGVDLKFSDSKELADSLDLAVLPSDPYFNKLMRIMTTRCMMQAVYFCAGTQPEREFWHYGLASPIYTHFTSPIRRYADLVVHRLLSACIGYDKEYAAALTDKTKMTEMSDVLNYRHRQAQQAARSSVELYTTLYFKNKQIIEQGYVVRILKNGFIVLIPKYGIEGIVHSNDAMVYDSNNESLCSGDITISIFKKVKVEVSVEDAGQQAQRSKLSLKLMEPKIAGLNM